MQLEKLAGCDKVFKEKRSGVDTGRPELKRCSSNTSEKAIRSWWPRLIAWRDRRQTSIASSPN